MHTAPADRLNDMLDEVFFKDEELVAGEPPPDAVRVEGIARKFAFHPERLAAKRSAIVEVIRDVVPDQFLKGRGGGWSFLNLCTDRKGELWTGLHTTMELLVALAIGLGLGGYCAPRRLWATFPGGVPYVWFDSV